MPKATVTQAIWEYLTPETSGIPNLGSVYTALPKVANESDLFQNSYPGIGLGAVIYMFMTAQSERRIALGGVHSGRKFRIYNLGLLIVFKSNLSQTVQGQAAFDDFIDNLTAYVEADRNAGNAQVVFQWGEGGEAGGTDLQFDYTFPRTLDGGVTLFQGVGHISVCEILNT